MVSIKDIAKELKLGVSTVSMALNNHPMINVKTKEMINAKAKELGYIKNGIAYDLQRKKTNVILVVVTDASRSYFSRFISIVQKEIAKHGFDMLISTVESSVNTAKKYISEHRADGAIIYTNKIDDDFLKQYAAVEFPIFVIGHFVEGENIYCDVNRTDIVIGNTAVNYLIAKGHKKIAFVKGSVNTLGTPRRLIGYKKALFDNNIPIDEGLIYDALGSTFEDGYNITKEIIKKLDDIDAIYYANDDIAIGGLKALSDNNIKVPTDISVIGNNNLPESALITPALTTVGSKTHEKFNEYVDILVKAINKEFINKEEIYFNSIINDEVIIERETVINNKGERK